MHDDPRLYPHLPSRPLDPDEEHLIAVVVGTVWQTCWEYVLTHQLTDAEGSAFWHGASLVHDAMERARVAAREDGIRQAVEWLRADYQYGTGPDWREHGAEWITNRLGEERVARMEDGRGTE